MALTLTVGGVSQTAFLQEGTASLKLNTLDFTLVDPNTIPAGGNAVALTTPTWNGTVVSVSRRPGPKPGHDYCTVTATNTDVASASSGPFGLSDNPNGSSTFGYKDLQVTVSTNLDTTTTTTGTCTLWHTGLWPAMTFGLTNADLGYSAQSFSVREMAVTWLKGVPIYSLTFGDPIVTMAVWTASQAANAPDGSISGTKITDLSVTTPKLAAGAVTAAKITAGTITTTQLSAGNIALYASDGTTTALDGSGFGPAWARFIQSGLFNSDFGVPTANTGADIDNSTNALPAWTYRQISGTKMTARCIVDSSGASGYAVRFSMAAGGAAGDDVCIEQYAPVNGSRARIFAYDVVQSFIRSASAVANTVSYVNLQYYLRDKATTTGSVQESTFILDATSNDIRVYNLADGLAVALTTPADAYWARIRVGWRRGTAATSAVDSLTIPDVAMFGYPNEITFGVPAGPTSGPAYVGSLTSGGLYLSNYAATAEVELAGTSVSIVGRLTTDTDQMDAQYAGVATFQNAGAVSDAPFPIATPLNGTLATDTTNHRIYYKRGGAWHYVAETAGFQVPTEETDCPACGAPLLAGESVVGTIERVMDDGALHGLYVHARCAGVPIRA